MGVTARRRRSDYSEGVTVAGAGAAAVGAAAAAPLPIWGHWLARCSYLQAVEALWCPIHDGVERGSTS